MGGFPRTDSTAAGGADTRIGNTHLRTNRGAAHAGRESYVVVHAVGEEGCDDVGNRRVVADARTCLSGAPQTPSGHGSLGNGRTTKRVWPVGHHRGTKRRTRSGLVPRNGHFVVLAIARPTNRRRRDAAFRVLATRLSSVGSHRTHVRSPPIVSAARADAVPSWRFSPSHCGIVCGRRDGHANPGRNCHPAGWPAIASRNADARTNARSVVGAIRAVATRTLSHRGECS